MLVNKENSHNGIHFSSVQSDKFKASVLVFSIILPLSPIAMAHCLLLSGLLRRGTHTFPSMSELNRRLDELYGSYVEIRSSLIGNNLCLVISTEILDNKYIPDQTDVIDGVIDIISQILLTPHLCDDNFDVKLFSQEKKIVYDNLLAEKNNTRAYSIKRCAELLGENTSLAPTYQELKQLVKDASFEDVKEYYTKVILPSPIDVFYMGASESSQIKEKIKLHFPQKASAPLCAVLPPIAYTRKEFSLVKEKMAVSQGKLALGFSTGVTISATDDRYYAALMLNEIFGGSASSKLFVNVREKMSLCYYCSSSYSIYTGALMVSCGIEVNRFDIAKKAILSQLEDIRNGKISEHELKAAKKSISNSYRQLYDSPFDVQSFYSGRELFGVADGIEECISKLMAVTTKEIIELAKLVSLDAIFFIEGTEENTEIEEGDTYND